MLLPSAIPCDRMASSTTSQRPKLQSFTAYTPQLNSLTCGGSGLIASCRALHSILGGSVQSPPQTSVPSTPLNPFAVRLQSSPAVVIPPRSANKRRRDEYEEDDVDHSAQQQYPQPREDRELFQTPKRQRRIPLDIPAGLKESDFASLGTPLRSHNLSSNTGQKQVEDIEMPLAQSKETQSSMKLSPIQTRSRRRSKGHHRQPLSDELYNEPENYNREIWSPNDDRRLVEAVLSKLNLSKRDWNDCAKQLGKDKDSLGKRWKMLIGEGNVGLRRGIGRHERNDLDIRSW